MTRSTSKTTTPEQQEQPKSERKSNDLLKARHAAVDKLIAAHNEEFQSLYVAEAEALGVKYTPPLTDAQKAKAQLDAIIAKHPELAEQLREQAAAGVAVEGVPSPTQAGDLATG